MNIRTITTVFVLALFLGCGDKTNESNTPEPSEIVQNKKTITAKTIESFKYNDYIFSNDAEKVVREWSKYQELLTQISFLKKADITFFTTEKDTLKNFLDSLKLNIPQTINTNSINARISVLETKLLKLNDDLSLENYNVDYKLQSIKELLIANSNLIYVINKKLEFDSNDVARPEE